MATSIFFFANETESRENGDDGKGFVWLSEIGNLCLDKTREKDKLLLFCIYKMHRNRK